MFVSKDNISNGIQFSAIESDKFKASVLVFSITLPLTPKALAMTALISGLLRRGTHLYPSMAELNRQLDELYGSYVEIRSSVLGNNLCLNISSEILDNKYIPDNTDTLGGVIDIISQIMLSPHMCDNDFNRQLFLQEQKIIQNNILAEKNNTRSYAIKQCIYLMGEGTSLSPADDELSKIIENIEFSDVLDYYKNQLICSPMDVFYVGATDAKAVADKVKHCFSSKPCALPRRITPPGAYKRQKFCDVCEQMPVSQGKLAMGFSTGVNISSGGDGYYTALMLNELLGGSASSKLFVNVREKMSLCYYCSSSYSIYTGALTVSAGIETEKVDTVKEAILAQLKDICDGKISEYEFKAAQKSISNSYRQLYDNPFDIQSFYGGRELFGIKDGIEECRAKLMSVTLKDVITLASNITLDVVYFIRGNSCDNDEEEFEND